MNNMRRSIKQFIKIITETLPIQEPIYEFGSLQVPGQEGFADLRPFFPGKEYVGADICEGPRAPGVDRILNLHEIDLPSESVGTVLVLDTLEHVEFVRKAIAEVYRILKPNGVLVISSVMNFPIHEYPSDYWRFTPEAFKSLLSNAHFSSFFIDFAGNESFPHTVIGVGFKGPMPRQINELKERLKKWKKDWKESESEGARVRIKSLIPPLVLTLYRKIRYGDATSELT